jgi:hypothetical protein
MGIVGGGQRPGVGKSLDETNREQQRRKMTMGRVIARPDRVPWTRVRLKSRFRLAGRRWFVAMGCCLSASGAQSEGELELEVGGSSSSSSAVKVWMDVRCPGLDRVPGCGGYCRAAGCSR